MGTRGERNVGLSLIVVGMGAIAFALISGLTTDSDGTDWVGIITAGAGLVVTLTGLFMAFRSGSAHA
jgi:hypothetical protein